MKYLEARDAIFTIFKTWADAQTPVIPIAWPDVPFDKDSVKTSFLQVAVKHATGAQQAFVGGTTPAKVWGRAGVASATVCTPIARGLRVGYTLAQGLTDSIQSSVDSVVWFRNVRIRELGSEGGYERVQVLFNFEYTDLQ